MISSKKKYFCNLQNLLHWNECSKRKPVPSNIFCILQVIKHLIEWTTGREGRRERGGRCSLERLGRIYLFTQWRHNAVAASWRSHSEWVNLRLMPCAAAAAGYHRASRHRVKRWRDAKSISCSATNEPSAAISSDGPFCVELQLEQNRDFDFLSICIRNLDDEKKATPPNCHPVR